MADWRQDRIGAAHRGENPTVLARMPSGFAVIGDRQHLPGRHAFSEERHGELKAVLGAVLEDLMCRVGRWPSGS